MIVVGPVGDRQTALVNGLLAGCEPRPSIEKSQAR